MEAQEGSGGFGIGRILPERGGGRPCRSWGREWPLANLGEGEASYGSSEAAHEPRQDRGLYIARRGQFPWPRISSPANCLAVARATWQQCALADEAADELALLQETGGKRWWLVGTY